VFTVSFLLFLFVAFLLSSCYHNVVNKDDYKRATVVGFCCQRLTSSIVDKPSVVIFIALDDCGRAVVKFLKVYRVWDKVILQREVSLLF